MELIAKSKTTTTPDMYKEFFKLYYKEKTKILVLITFIIGLVLMFLGVGAYVAQRGVLAVVILLCSGGMLVVYPHFIYKRPYNSVKDNVITTQFEFYDDKIIEINDASSDEYSYNSIYRIVETKKYMYIYYTKEQASVIDKEGFIYGNLSDVKRVLSDSINIEYRK